MLSYVLWWYVGAMPRVGKFTPSTHTRLSGLVSIDVLTRVVPPESVD